MEDGNRNDQCAKCKGTKYLDKACPHRHPKRCKYNVTSRFQGRCSYLHGSIEIVGVMEDVNTTEKKANKLKYKITMLQDEY